MSSPPPCAPPQAAAQPPPRPPAPQPRRRPPHHPHRRRQHLLPLPPLLLPPRPLSHPQLRMRTRRWCWRRLLRHPPSRLPSRRRATSISNCEPLIVDFSDALEITSA